MNPVAGPTRVLHLLNGEQYSGLERVVDQLIAGASAGGFRMDLMLLKPQAMRRRMFSRCDVVHNLPMRSRFDFGVASAAARIAKESGCAPIHSHTVRSALVARRVQRLTGLPWAHHVHSPALQDSERTSRNLLNFVAEASVLRHANMVMAVSQGLASYVARRYRVAPERVAVVANGVSDRLRADSTAIDPVATILTVGLFRPRKGIEHLVDATALLIGAGHGIRLRLVGEFADAGHEASIRARVKRLGLERTIDFMGFVPDVAQVLDAGGIFVLPSLYGEGMPMALLEAMAAGLPTVASDIDGVRELLAGDSGLLVPAGSAPLLAHAIGKLIADPGLRVKLALAAQSRQRRWYSVQRMRESVFEQYRRLLVARADAKPRTARR